MVSPCFLNNCEWNKDLIQEDFDPTIGSNDNNGDDGGIREEIKKSLKKYLPNLEENSEAILPNALENFESDDIVLKFHLLKTK